MTFVPSARRLRPTSFENVVGQDVVVRILQNAIRMGRVADSYVFSGPSGCGKTTVARVFAAALNCEPDPSKWLNASPPFPCGACPSCRDIEQGRSDLVHEIDAASDRGVTMVEALQDVVRQLLPEKKWRVIILDEAHELTPKAWTAFLKTIEEPPPRNVFIFVTTVRRKVPETVLSRSSDFVFAPIPERVIAMALRLHIWESEIEPPVFDYVAHVAAGSMRDALHIMDQLELGGPHVTLRDVEAVSGVSLESTRDIADALLSRDFSYFLTVIDRVGARGMSYRRVAEVVLDLSRDFLVARTGYPKMRSLLSVEAIGKNLEGFDEDALWVLHAGVRRLFDGQLLGTRSGLETMYVSYLHGLR